MISYPCVMNFNYEINTFAFLQNKRRNFVRLAENANLGTRHSSI